MTTDAPTVLELFAGAGGAALGLERAGFEHAALCEWAPDACATLRAAGLGPVVEGDVRDLDAIEAVAGPRVDVLWSSFPCQAFSTAGKRLGASDERNGWPWTIDAIDRFRPAWVACENVRGLLSHSGEHCGDTQKCPGCYFHGVILPDLRERFAHVGYWVLDAADYGVPQRRGRVIIWAGPRPLSAPPPTHCRTEDIAQGDLFGRSLKPWMSMREALDLDAGLMFFPSGTTGFYAPTSVGTPSQAITGKGNQYLAKITNSPSPSVVCNEVKGSGPGGSPEKFQRASDLLYLLTGRRRLTPAECAILQDFPASHPWQGNKTSIYRQIGNAVPPRLAEVVGIQIMHAIKQTQETR